MHKRKLPFRQSLLNRSNQMLKAPPVSAPTIEDLTLYVSNLLTDLSKTNPNTLSLPATLPYGFELVVEHTMDNTLKLGPYLAAIKKLMDYLHINENWETTTSLTSNKRDVFIKKVKEMFGMPLSNGILNNINNNILYEIISINDLDKFPKHVFQLLVNATLSTITSQANDNGNVIINMLLAEAAQKNNLVVIEILLKEYRANPAYLLTIYNEHNYEEKIETMPVLCTNIYNKTIKSQLGCYQT